MPTMPSVNSFEIQEPLVVKEPEQKEEVVVVQATANKSTWGKKKTCLLVTTIALGTIGVVGYLVATNIHCSNVPEVTYTYHQYPKPLECYESSVEYDAPGWYADNCAPHKYTHYPQHDCYYQTNTVGLVLIAVVSYCFSTGVTYGAACIVDAYFATKKQDEEICEITEV